MASTRTTFTLDEELAEWAKKLGINVSAAARDGVAAAVRRAMGEAERESYRLHPEPADGGGWDEIEAWGEP